MSFKFHKASGFSLAETLIALGILAIGMLLIAGVFPVAIRLTTMSAERTTAAVVAEEAFAKVQLYAAGDTAISTDNVVLSRLTDNSLTDFNDPTADAFPAIHDIGQYEFTYPSTGSSNANISAKQYCWSALCRLTGPAIDNPPVQVTVFVCRKAGRASKFHEASGGIDGNWPVPVRMTNVLAVPGNNDRLQLPSGDKNFVNDNYTIVDNGTGQIYRVVRRLPATSAAPADDRIIQLDRDWQGGINDIWVVPPAVGGGRSPCIAVYQKLIKF